MKKVPGVLKSTFFILKLEVLCITSVSYNVLLLSMFGVLQSTEIKMLEYVFLVLKNSTLTSPYAPLKPLLASILMIERDMPKFVSQFP